MDFLLPMLSQIFLPAAGTIVATLASVGLARANKWVRQKTDNEAVDAAMTRITRTAETVVAELNQTVVPGVIEAAADGKISGNEARNLRNIALGTVKQRLPAATLDVARTATNSLTELLASKVEQAVLNQKHLRPLTAAVGEVAAPDKSGD